MNTEEKTPGYMVQLLEELGWNQGTRIPLASAENQILENSLINRQNELQRLKETLTLQKQKLEDIRNYKGHVHSEYQENTRLLFAHKQNLEQEIKLHQLALSEVEGCGRDVVKFNKEITNISTRIDRFQNNIARLLKKADTLKSEVCGERVALQDWRAALERSSGDITAIEQFSKQDTSRAKALDNKRQKMKVEHDRMQERLNQLVSNLASEERACERISVQMAEGMEQRKQMMVMWTTTVENLRQRDMDIKNIREEYAALENEANNVTEQCREQQAFCEQQRGNNADAEKENMALAHRLGQLRLQTQQLTTQNVSLDSEVQSLQRELSNMRLALEKLHMENRRIMDEQHRKDVALEAVNQKIKELKRKLIDSTDKTKSSEKRARELEEMLSEEERYASQMTVSQQHAMHCSFVEQQKLFALKNDDKLFHMSLKSTKAIISKLEYKQRGVMRNLQSQKESLYAICYQVETLGARVLHMEGVQAEREYSAELLEKENRLKDVCARHAARVALLERHSGKLTDEMRRLGRELDSGLVEHEKLQSRLKMWMLSVEGVEKEVRSSREEWRRSRVEEALVRLRVAHASRALAGLGDTQYALDNHRLHLQAAMNERLVEIGARRDMLGVQKRALFEDCGKLRSEIKERENRIEQLVKRYDIFISSLGKDESGEQLSVTFFKIKFAAERASLRARGAALDAEVSRRERDISALEATLRVVHAAHAHFMHRIAPLADDTPEITQLNELMKQYYATRDELKVVYANVEVLEKSTKVLVARLDQLIAHADQLATRLADAENDVENAQERVRRHQGRLQNARDLLQHYTKRAKKLIDSVDDWRMFQMATWNREYADSAQSAIQALASACAQAPREAPQRFAVLLSATDLQRHLTRHQRSLHLYIQRLISQTEDRVKESVGHFEESVLSSSSESTKSGVSIASGYTKKLSAFRKTVAPKVQEPSLIDDIPEQARRSTVSLRVVTLGMGDDSSRYDVSSDTTLPSRKSLR